MKMKMKIKMMDLLGWTPIPCKHPNTPAAMVDTTSLLSRCQTSTSAPRLGHALPLGHPKDCAHLCTPLCPQYAPIFAGGGSGDLGASGLPPWGRRARRWLTAGSGIVLRASEPDSARCRF